MPAYVYSCTSDGCTEWAEVWHWTIPKDRPSPPACSQHGNMVRDWHLEKGGHRPGGYPYVHPHLTGTGEKVEIKSPAHEREMYRHYSLLRSGGKDPEMLKPRPDKAFINDRVETGPDGLRRTVEGRGDGMPGCWTSVPALLNETPEEIEKFFQRNSG